MAWYLPIGVYEGIKLTSEITDSTVDLSADGEIPHAVLRLGSGSIPVPAEYAKALECLAGAPGPVQIEEWVMSASEPAEASAQIEKLMDLGLVMALDEQRLKDSALNDLRLDKRERVSRWEEQPEAYARSGSVGIRTREGSTSVDEATLAMLDALPDHPVAVKDALRSLESLLPEDRKSFADPILQADLRGLVRLRAAVVYLQE